MLTRASDRGPTPQLRKRPALPPAAAAGGKAKAASPPTAKQAASPPTGQPASKRARSDITTRGFDLECGMLSSKLVAALLRTAKAGGGREWRDISNAKEKYLPDEPLLDCLRDEVAQSPVIRKAVKDQFGAHHFKITNASIISTPPGTPPQIPHADDTCVRELFAVVQLLDGQRPTMYEPYDPQEKYPVVNHAKLNDGAVLSATVKQQLRAAFGKLLEDGAPELCKELCQLPCGSPAAGDGMVALPTLIHRGPGTVGSKKWRHVLFFSVRPVSPGGAGTSTDVYDKDYQIHNEWLLHALGSSAEEEEKVLAMYSAAGYSQEHARD